MKSSDPDSLISAAESAWGGPVAASRHLGIAHSSWQGYKSGARALPEYIRRSILAHLAIEADGPSDDEFVLCESDTGDGGWSIHAPGSTNADIADGGAPAMVSGIGQPKAVDFDAARWAMRRFTSA